MKRMLLGLLAAALIGSTPALAQPPVPPAPPLPPAPASLVTTDCGHGARKNYVCVPETYVRKTTRWVYSTVCEPICPAYYHGFGLFHKDCGGCDSGHCEHPYMRKYLVKKPRICEEPAVGCVPQRACGHDGCCATDGCIAPAAPGVVFPGASIGAPIPLPLQKMPSPTGTPR
jgi:hypothetical protein